MGAKIPGAAVPAAFQSLMADRYVSGKSELGSSFLNAMWIAGFIATVQMVAVAMAVLKRSPISESGFRPEVNRPTVTLRPGDTPDDRPLEETFEPVAGDAARAEEGKRAGAAPVARPPIPDLTDAPRSVTPISDELLERLVETGIELRESGDHEKALQALQDAEANIPDHPRVLGEIAVTLTHLGRNAEARQYWEKVEALGEGAGGDYHDIASRIVDGRPLPRPARRLILELGKIRVARQKPPEGGERVRLVIPIVGDPSLRPSGRDMNVRVFFYDLVDGERSEPTTAQISYEFPTKPYDWQENGTEEIEVIYFQPVFTLEQKRELGERTYEGYVIELDYRDQLQDIASSSPELRNLRFQQSEAAEPQGGPPDGPEGSLFPDQP